MRTRNRKGTPLVTYICRNCGVAYEESASPARCFICSDERHFLGPQGQEWTNLAEMRQSYQNEFRAIDEGLTGIVTVPPFGMGHRSILVQTPGGNLLWDPISYIDEQTVARISGLGGVAAIAISHPHAQGAMSEWSRAFGNAPIYANHSDQSWLASSSLSMKLWSGTLEVLPQVTLVQCGGHFDGSAVAHCFPDSPRGGALLVGDTMMVVRDRRFVTFMWSYTNQIPLSEAQVNSITHALSRYDFERIFGTTWGNEIFSGAKAAVTKSAERYIRRLRAPA